jgi:pimeloyl-[acyl-carrier protein] synthase
MGRLRQRVRRTQAIRMATQSAQANGALSEEPLGFNPFLPEVREDPYPLYRRLREEDPVHSSFPGLWVLTRHADCTAMLKDHRRFSSDSRNSELYRVYRASMGDQEIAMLADDAPRSMLFVDPPDHARLRTLVNKVFTARVVESMRPHMQEIVDGILDGFAEREGASVDLVSELAYPLPIAVICQMLGVPNEDWDLFRHWSGELVLTLDPLVTLDVPERANEALEGFRQYFDGLYRERRVHPTDDVLSALLEAEEKGERLSHDELFSTSILLLVAGHETTVNLISNGVLALLRHPDQLMRLQEDPSLIRTAVEELLRYDSPVQLTGRTVMEQVEIGGHEIPRGHQVVGVLGAANRDPEQFPDPDRLDIGREDNRHVAFGGGIHFCLGAPLARVEGQIAIGSLLRRFRAIDLADAHPERRETVTLRGLKSLSVRLHA